MIIFSIILTSLSTLAVILAIVFEGKLKKGNKDKITYNSFRKEIKSLSLFAWVLISISILMNIGNGYNSYKSIVDNKKQYQEDTTRYVNLLNASDHVIKQFTKQRLSDSVRISSLEKLTKVNGLKSDSIKLSVVDNATKAMEEQRKAIEHERENIFTHMKCEVQDNLKIILTAYGEKYVKSLADSNYFIAPRLKNTYITKYEFISSNDVIIDYFMETSEVINRVNQIADILIYDEAKSKNKKLNIESFLANVNDAKTYLYAIYGRIIWLDSYKEYESIDFHDSIPLSNRNTMNTLLIIDYLTKKGLTMDSIFNNYFQTDTL